MTPLCSPKGLRSDLEDSCREAFWTSLLLTGSVLQAEALVIEAIELWNPGDTVEGALTRYVIDRSVQAREAVDIRLASQIVLRVLANLSRQACECILGLTGFQVDRYTTAALADLAENERERS